ncbi:hypothetical protein PG996_012604 [Apiospora saccharicola]|uniref:Uncharacterized protein n=1 Tax=Apiospora saccharicola TaxID=335842 RepID=A0ABR1U399_9PEZI
MGGTHSTNGQIFSTSCPYKPPDGSFTLDCGHAFYHVPLGVTGQDKSWHSCIYAKFHPSKKHLEAKRNMGANPTTILTELKSGSPTWLINAVINWGNAAVATALQNELNKHWMKKSGTKSNRNIISSNLLGVNQSIQVQGDLSDNPSTLRQSLISSAAEYLSSYHAGPDKDTDKPKRPSDGTDPKYDGLPDGNMPSQKSSATGTPVPRSSMPHLVPEVNVTMSQLVYVPDTPKKV